MKKNQNRKKILSKFSKKKKILLIFLIIILILEIFLISNKIYLKYIKTEEEIYEVEQPKDKIEDYNYYLNNNATNYEEDLFNELKEVLEKENIIEKDYATILTKIFIADLFTLNTKKSSSDITSSYYIYDDYKDIYAAKLKETLYANIELNINETRTQDLPIVSNVEVISIENKEFKLKDKILDSNAYYINSNITYKKNLGYPKKYQVVLIKQDKIFKIVKTGEVL